MNEDMTTCVNCYKQISPYEKYCSTKCRDEYFGQDETELPKWVAVFGGLVGGLLIFLAVYQLLSMFGG